MVVLFPSQVAGLIPVSNAAGHPRKWPSLASLQILCLLQYRTQGLCVCVRVVHAVLIDTHVFSTACLIGLSLSVCAVRHGASDPAVWAGTLGHPAGGHWLHWGGDDAVWSSTGRKHCCWSESYSCQQGWQRLNTLMLKCNIESWQLLCQILKYQTLQK